MAYLVIHKAGVAPYAFAHGFYGACQRHQTFGLVHGVAAAEGNIEIVVGYMSQKLVGCYVFSGIEGPGVRVVASRAAVGAARDVHGERHLVRNLLEYDVVVGVLQHRSAFYAVRALRSSRNSAEASAAGL